MAGEQASRLTMAHVAAQLGIRASVLRDIMKLFPMWRIFEADSLNKFVAVIVALAQQRSVNSSAVAARYFTMFREIDAGLTAGRAVVLAEPPSAAQVRAVVNVMVASFWSAINDGATTDQARQVALARLQGGIGRIAMNGGRETLLRAIHTDNHYRGGYIRVSDGNPCAFCAMLLGRGPGYLSRDSAGEGTNTSFIGIGSAKFHDNCGCSIQPFGGGEWPELNRDLQDLWYAAKDEARGTGRDNYSVFRSRMRDRILDAGGKV